MLSVSHLSKTYRPGDPPALSDVSLTVQQGERVALLGPSGAGKSTLIRCINGLARPDSGQVVVGGREVTAITGDSLRAARREIAVIFQEFHLIDRLPALTNVIAGRFGHYSLWRNMLKLWRPEDKAEALRLLDRVGLGAQAQSPARELSGGQRQRVAIARAMMQAPSLLLGDEPVASLDPVTAATILTLIRDLSQERGVTTILSLHDVRLAQAFCDRAIGISGGRVVYDGPVDGLSTEALAQIYRSDAMVVSP